MDDENRPEGFEPPDETASVEPPAAPPDEGPAAEPPGEGAEEIVAEAPVAESQGAEESMDEAPVVEEDEEYEPTPRVKPEIPGADLEVDIVAEGEDPLARLELGDDELAAEEL